MHDPNNYHAFSLNTATRARIIALGVRKRFTQTPYRRSRAGQRLSHHIPTIQRQTAKDTTHREGNQINHNNLIKITLNNNRNIYLKISHINAHSIYHKTQSFQEHILSNDVSLCAITESWLPSDEEDLRYKEVPPLGYNILSEPRADGRRGGGLALVYKDHLKPKSRLSHMTELLELMNVDITIKGTNINLYIVYRPPKGNVVEFCNSLATILENNINIDRGKLLMLGDFNIHLDEENNRDTRTFNDFLESFGLINYTTFFTHTAKHILDLVISNDSTLVHSVLPGHVLSDHLFVHATLKIIRPIPQRKTVRYRKYRNLDSNQFKQDLIDGFLEKSPSTMDDMVQQYNDTIITALDKQIPEKTKLVRDTHHQPWFDDKIKKEIILRCKRERDWIRDQSEYSWRAFYNQRRHVSNIIKTAQKNYLKGKIEENKNDYKAIFNIANSLLFRKQESPLPNTTPLSALAEDFSEFFEGKIDRIMLDLKTKRQSIPTDLYQQCIEEKFKTTCRMSNFIPVSNDEINDIIRTAPPKHCELDPLPTNIMKEHKDILAHPITRIVNVSLNTGCFSLKLKEAILRPLIKNIKLEPILNNYRPVSNLSYLSKLIERIVCKQLTRYTNSTGQMESYQSAYREHSSTETALLKIKADILDAVDKKEVMCLVMLDLSSAFDTISHELLLKRLKYRFGITDTVLQWIESFLTNRTQYVKVSNRDGTAVSSKKMLKQGVPQGSVLGPVLFNLFISPLGEICHRHKINFHGYADDSQNYMSFRPQHHNTVNQDTSIKNLENCLEDIRTWMSINFLKLNENKTEFIIIGVRQQLDKVKEPSIKIGDDKITNSAVVKNLGVYIDCELKLSTHVNKIVSSSFNTLRNISRIRHHLDCDSTKILVQSLIISKLDYCNSLFLGIPQYNLDKLQRIHNMSCRVIKQLPKSAHITGYLAELHWLKIEQRIKYKVSMLMFKCLHNLAPQYLIDITIFPYHQDLNLRSRNNFVLPTRRSRITMVHTGSISSMGPRIWNSLPMAVKNTNNLDIFKSKLKTYLFTQSYNNF